MHTSPEDPRHPSRRDFLALSAAGLLHLATRGLNRRRAVGAPLSDGVLLYVGTYTEGHPTEGIYLVRMDPRTGELRRVGSANAGENPSFLALHPNGRVLYAVNEVMQREGRATGAVTAFAIAAGSGALTRLGTQASEGAAPCYVSVHPGGRAALVANYMGGSVALLPILADGSLAAASSVDQHHGRGPKPEQEAAHAHCIIPDPSGRFALSTDLGIDRVLVYRIDPDAGTLHHMEGGDAEMRPGAGPRHLAFHPTLPLVYVASELDSTVTPLAFDAARGVLSPGEPHSTLPAGWHGTNAVADVHVARSGKALYVSNRGHNSIAVFTVADATGALALEQVVPCGGDWPRNFALDPTERWLLVANERSGSVVVFARDAATGRLAPTPHHVAVPGPVCLRFGA